MTIQSGVLGTPETSPLPSIWSQYEKKLCEVKKHVDDQIAILGFEGVSFDQKSIVSQDSKVVINAIFHGGNDMTFDSTSFVLVGESCENLSVQELVKSLVLQAKIISLDAIKSAVSEAKLISNKDIVVLKENSSEFLVACFDGKLKESGKALVMGIPKRNVICCSSQIMAQVLVDSFGHPGKLEDGRKFLIIGTAAVPAEDPVENTLSGLPEKLSSKGENEATEGLESELKSANELSIFPGEKTPSEIAVETVNK